MGIDISAVRFLITARSMNVDFTETAMIGRQALYLTFRELETELRRASLGSDDAAIDSILNSSNGYAEQLLRFLGAREVHSIDISSYEGATHIHDLNQPIPEHFKERYDVVFDGGSLEHVFNFPAAIKNCMEMVRVGGHFISIAPANNFMGHGFYQFSPELYFSIFHNVNGYCLRALILSEERNAPSWFHVRNPGDLGTRVELINDCPAYLLVLAKRLQSCAILQSPPQQSDYSAAWQSSYTQSNWRRVLHIDRNFPKRFLRTHIPHSLRQYLLRKKIARFRRYHFQSIRVLKKN